jgi:hypothetical protein
MVVGGTNEHVPKPIQPLPNRQRQLMLDTDQIHGDKREFLVAILQHHGPSPERIVHSGGLTT